MKTVLVLSFPHLNWRYECKTRQRRRFFLKNWVVTRRIRWCNTGDNWVTRWMWNALISGGWTRKSRQNSVTTRYGRSDPHWINKTPNLLRASRVSNWIRPSRAEFSFLPNITEFYRVLWRSREGQNVPVASSTHRPANLVFPSLWFCGERERERDGAANKNGDKLINRPSNGRSRPPASANQWNMAFEDTLSVSFLVLPEVGPSCNEFAK